MREAAEMSGHRRYLYNPLIAALYARLVAVDALLKGGASSAAGGGGSPLPPTVNVCAAGGDGTHAIQKDLQRMFARKISFSTGAFGGGGGGKVTVASMLTHVCKLTLKTLVEEVRLGTFSRAGLQQLQADCAMLRWVLSPSVDDEGSVQALLDEALISCQERCLDPVLLEHAAVEDLCERKRRDLAAAAP